jgi:hypothetical protein
VTLTTPTPPGAIDRPADPRQILGYLGALGDWLAERRQELDRLDRAILGRPEADAQTGDLMVALSVWQAIERRHKDLLQTWDSGRVGPVQLRQLAQLIWGRLDDAPVTPPATDAATPRSVGAGQGWSINLLEACRLLEALTAQLMTNLRVTPSSTQSTYRLAGLRAQAERLRDQVQLEPPDRRADLTRAVEAVATEIAHLTDKAERGGDIGGLLGPLEIQAARLERDLIVGNARRRQLQARGDEVSRQRMTLEARELATTRLTERVRQQVLPAPKYAVPHVGALGALPATEAELDAYADRLAQVGRALDVVDQANRSALAELEQLRAEFAALPSDGPTPADPTLVALAEQAQALLDRTPTPVAVVRPILAAYRAALATGADGTAA